MKKHLDRQCVVKRCRNEAKMTNANMEPGKEVRVCPMHLLEFLRSHKFPIMEAAKMVGESMTTQAK